MKPRKRKREGARRALCPWRDSPKQSRSDRSLAVSETDAAPTAVSDERCAFVARSRRRCSVAATSHRGRGTYTRSRDGKFRAIFKSGAEKRRFSVPLLVALCHQINPRKSKLNTEMETERTRGANTELFKMRILSPNAPRIAQVCTYIFTNFPG